MQQMDVTLEVILISDHTSPSIQLYIHRIKISPNYNSVSLFPAKVKPAMPTGKNL
jgi:hypothetical protein